MDIQKDNSEEKLIYFTTLHGFCEGYVQQELKAAASVDYTDSEGLAQVIQGEDEIRRTAYKRAIRLSLLFIVVYLVMVLDVAMFMAIVHTMLILQIAVLVALSLLVMEILHLVQIVEDGYARFFAGVRRWGVAALVGLSVLGLAVGALKNLGILGGM